MSKFAAIVTALQLNNVVIDDHTASATRVASLVGRLVYGDEEHALLIIASPYASSANELYIAEDGQVHVSTKSMAVLSFNEKTMTFPGQDTSSIVEVVKIVAPESAQSVSQAEPVVAVEPVNFLPHTHAFIKSSLEQAKRFTVSRFAGNFTNFLCFYAEAAEPTLVLECYEGNFSNSGSVLMAETSPRMPSDEYLVQRTLSYLPIDEAAKYELVRKTTAFVCGQANSEMLSDLIKFA